MSSPGHQSLRVGIDVGPLYGHRTGIGVAVDGIVEGLDRRDDVTTVPYLTSFRSPPRPGHRRLPVPGIVASHLWSRLDRPRADRWLAGCDVVHGTNYVVPPTSLPAVVSVYDCWFLAHPEAATPVVRRAGARLRRAVDRGAWVHASSAATARSVTELLGTDRVVTIHLGPPTLPPVGDRSGDGVSRFDGRPFVLAIGTEERRKGLPLLVDAFGAVAARHPGLLLVLAGASGDDSDRIGAAVAASPVADRIVRVGAVDDRRKAELLRSAAVLAYPSLDEGFGFPILEAQAAGTPIVATDVGSVAEVAGDGAVLVPDRSVDAFAAALDEVLAGRTDRSGLVTAGRANLGRFSWEATVSGLVDLYRTVVLR